jgi:hypothetical protein
MLFTCLEFYLNFDVIEPNATLSGHYKTSTIEFQRQFSFGTDGKFVTL